MRHMPLFASIFLVAILGPFAAAEEHNGGGLGGKEVVARIYRNWKLTSYRRDTAALPLERPEAPYEKVWLRIRDGAVCFDLNNVDKNSVILINGTDQTDPVVKKTWGNIVYAECADPRPEVSFTNDGYYYTCRGSRKFYRRDRNSLNYHWLFKDAFGNPISGGRLEIYLCDRRNPTKVKIADLILDEKGCAVVPGLLDCFRRMCAVVSHADYTRAVIERIYPWWTTEFILPVVKPSPEAYPQSVWGTVVDDEDRPIAGALIDCFSVRTPGGGIINSTGRRWGGLTDEHGRFAVCMPTFTLEQGPTGIPQNSKYSICVKAPKSLVIPNHQARVLCGREVQLKLERPAGHFRTFVFEDANGPISDSVRLGRLMLAIEVAGMEQRGQLSFAYEDLKAGGMFPFGLYRALIAPYHDEPALNFAHLLVTEKSPTRLVFRPEEPNATLFRGSVVNGMTNRPIPGAFVAISDHGSPDFSALTCGQWQVVDAVQSELDPNALGLKILRQIRPIHALTRTDSRGLFEMKAAIPESANRWLLAFQRDYLTVKYGQLREKCRNNIVELPAVHLYPAATITLEPSIDLPDEYYNCHVEARLRFGSEGELDWLTEFRTNWRAKGLRSDWLKPNTVHNLQVPAYMDLTIELQVADHAGRRRRWWCPVLTETINASQGQVIDLGKVEIRQEMPVFVQVVDSASKGLEGVGVTHIDRLGWSLGQTYITDEQGFAEFRVPPYYQGQFAVGPPGPARDRVTESIAYQTNGPADANNVYTLQLSDEMLQKLFGQD